MRCYYTLCSIISNAHNVLSLYVPTHMHSKGGLQASHVLGYQEPGVRPILHVCRKCTISSSWKEKTVCFLQENLVEIFLWNINFVKYPKCHTSLESWGPQDSDAAFLLDRFCTCFDTSCKRYLPNVTVEIFFLCQWHMIGHNGQVTHIS